MRDDRTELLIAVFLFLLFLFVRWKIEESQTSRARRKEREGKGREGKEGEEWERRVEEEGEVVYGRKRSARVGVGIRGRVFCCMAHHAAQRKVK